jgi:hypothetical protein
MEQTNNVGSKSLQQLTTAFPSKERWIEKARNCSNSRKCLQIKQLSARVFLFSRHYSRYKVNPIARIIANRVRVEYFDTTREIKIGISSRDKIAFSRLERAVCARGDCNILIRRSVATNYRSRYAFFASKLAPARTFLNENIDGLTSRPARSKWRYNVCDNANDREKKKKEKMEHVEKNAYVFTHLSVLRNSRRSVIGSKLHASNWTDSVVVRR